MCGRTSASLSAPVLKRITRARNFVNQENYRPSYNIGPFSKKTNPPVLIHQNGERVLHAMQWGVIPQNSENANSLRNLATFNARLETINQTATWKRLIDRKRCVVVVDGFYEWKGKEKVPHFVRRKDGQPIYMAGLYDVYESNQIIDFAEDNGAEDDDNEFKIQEKIHSFTIITRKASQEIRFLHDRMPCILNDNEIDEYLDHKASFASVYHLLKAFPAEKLDIYPVVPLINRLRNDGADCQMHADEHRKKRGIGAMFKKLSKKNANNNNENNNHDSIKDKVNDNSQQDNNNNNNDNTEPNSNQSSQATQKNVDKSIQHATPSIQAVNSNANTSDTSSCSATSSSTTTNTNQTKKQSKKRHFDTTIDIMNDPLSSSSSNSTTTTITTSKQPRKQAKFDFLEFVKNKSFI